MKEEIYRKYNCCNQWILINSALCRITKHKCYEKCPNCGKNPTKYLATKRKCPGCGKWFVEPPKRGGPHIYCERCREIKGKASEIRRYRRRKRSKKIKLIKMCSRCGVNPVGKGLHFLCDDCFHNNTENYFEEENEIGYEQGNPKEGFIVKRKQWSY